MDDDPGSARYDASTTRNGGVGNAPRIGGNVGPRTTRQLGNYPDIWALWYAPRNGGVGNAPRNGGVGNAPRNGGVGNAPRNGGVGNAPRIGGVGNAPRIGGAGNAPRIGGVANAPRIGGAGNAPRIGGAGNAPRIGGDRNARPLGDEGYGRRNAGHGPRGAPHGLGQRAPLLHGQGHVFQQNGPAAYRNHQSPYRNQGANMRQHDRPDNRNDPQNRNENRPRAKYMGFKALEEIAEADSKNIIIKVNERKDALMNLLENSFDEDNYDMIFLIMKITAKVTQSSFDELKMKFLLDVCNSRFITTLRNYLIELPYVLKENQKRNRFYWNNPQEFWENFTTFCMCIVEISPATALHKCRSLIEGISKTCLEGLSERHRFNLSSEHTTKMAQIKERLTHCEKEDMIQAQNKAPNSADDDSEPPEDFRQLSVVPSNHDLLEKRPFLRPNIVNGGYRDVEHYLDVQFRLLREDCFGPLREGIFQYMENPNRKKFDHIRVYRNVTFVEPYISKTKIGSTVKLDENTTKRLKKINWAHSKRFIFGSLLLFTKDNCRTFIAATIMEREVKLLSQGKIPVSIVDDLTDKISNNDDYVMIESEVYFEPYFHVLKALQEPNFSKHIAMSKYIVHVDPVPKPPKYVTPEAVFAVQTKYDPKTKFRILHDVTWPTKEALGFDGTQYDAYKLALTHEFAVIQGPPGTGKTFLGVKVAKTLIENLTPPRGACLMLVICYTNHALDQFLEEILPVTKSIVRIGGQSRNEAMDKLNLNTLRRKAQVGRDTNKLFFEQKHNLRRAVLELQQAQESIDALNNAVISYSSMKDFAQESLVVGKHYADHLPEMKSDPLKHWLFENMEHVDFQNALVNEENELNAAVANEVDDDIYARNETILDDFDDENEVQMNPIFERNISTSFSLADAENKLRNLILLYNKIENIPKKEELQWEIVDLKSRIALFNQMAVNRTRHMRLHLDERIDPSRIPMADRWALYFRWTNAVTNKMKRHIQPLQAKLQSANTAYEESRMMVDLQILQGIKVIGMTTSGAARLRKLLRTLAPPIVIVEEAAEVLEQHIVTSLTESCEHLILIGDHQQLRPSAAHVKLARRYNLEISLFERMITNGMHSRRLGVQHRMRPELASLISPHIYSELENHPSVEHFPRVRGVADNLFFLTHDFMEEQVDDSSSRSNRQEAELALGLANYLMQQGYEDRDITVLAAYSGQMFCMRKQRDKYANLSGVKITVVDNYQGEESKIIILSLVRNNNENKIGFLGTENRICVALSRAREGFYILGNIGILTQNSDLWKKIAGTLQANASLGPALMLKCENHQEQISTISTPKDFEKVPEGGCLLKCNFNLPCGHQCPRVCHGYDRSHVKTKCNLKCERSLCELGHICPLICSVPCQPCKRLVEKTLPCNHNKQIYCHQEPTDPAVKCLTTVSVTLTACGHEAKKSCHMDTAMVRCSVRCVFRVDKCGHECRLKCHVTDDPDHERYLCEKPCAKAKKGCTAELVGERGDHQCPKRCHEDCDYCTVEVTKKRSTCTHSIRVACNVDADSIPCRKNCSRILACGHHCKKKCHEPCGDCRQKVTKTIPDCNHDVQILCNQEPTRSMCQRKCERILQCGHPCTAPCSNICDSTKCTEPIPETHTSPCGHQVTLPCNVYSYMSTGSRLMPELLLRHCTEPCTVELACGHVCGGSCSRCHQGRLHVACAQPCQQTNICGHRCQEPCNQVCPPCKAPCEIRCPHSRCNKLCGAPCVPCQEPCKRACVHGTCGRRCGEPCGRPPCDAPCPKRLVCGHRCRGLCGEPCPAVCRDCRPDEFPKDFLGYDFEEDDKFVILQDCTHVMEVADMDNLMTSDTETVAIRACPYCRKPILNTLRYKDHVNKMLRTEINPIKERVYGNEKVIRKRRDELLLKLAAFSAQYDKVFEENSHLKEAFVKLRTVVLQQKKESLLKLEMQFQYMDILDIVGVFYRKYRAANLKELEDKFLLLIKTICSALMANIQKISQQLQMDIGNEIKRMNSVVQLAKILNHPSYVTSKSAPKIADATETATAAVLTWGVYDEQRGIYELKALQEAVKVFGIVTKQERDLVVRAIGSKSGSWYKCPNGHFYSIADCGGAMEVSKCADCGASIGGTSHMLLSDNAHAGEVDDSRHSAWSNHYDNMENFRMN